MLERFSLPPHKAADATLTRHSFLPTRSGVVELVALFALLLAVEWLWLSPGDLAKVEPHPFWLPVVLLSLQYGTADGLLAAAAAILLSLLTGLPSQGVEEDYYRYLIRVWSDPVGWIIAAVVIGEIRARQRSQMAELRRDLAQSRIQAGEITAHCHRLDQKVLRLERELASIEAVSLDGLVAALADLRRPGGDAWRQAFSRAHRAALGSGVCTVLVDDGRGLVTAARSVLGAEAPGIAPQLHAEVLRRLLAEPRTFSALRSADAEVLGDGALLAGALCGSPGSRPVGLLVVGGLESGLLQGEVERRFDLLRRELGQALAERRIEELLEAASQPARGEPSAGRRPEPAVAATG